MKLRILKFETRYPANRDAQDFVLLAPVGEATDKSQTWFNIKSIRPRPQDIEAAENGGLSQRAMIARWEIVGPAYEAWKAGNEIPETGTPLGAWAALDAMQVEAMKRRGIRTVEEAAEMNDDTVTALGIPNARKLPALAKSWLSGRGDAKLADELATAQERMAAMEEMIAEMQRDKPKRGRPPKEAAA